MGLWELHSGSGRLLPGGELGNFDGCLREKLRNCPCRDAHTSTAHWAWQYWLLLSQRQSCVKVCTHKMGGGGVKSIHFIKCVERVFSFKCSLFYVYWGYQSAWQMCGKDHFRWYIPHDKGPFKFCWRSWLRNFSFETPPLQGPFIPSSCHRPRGGGGGGSHKNWISQLVYGFSKRPLLCGLCRRYIPPFHTFSPNYWIFFIPIPHTNNNNINYN